MVRVWTVILCICVPTALVAISLLGYNYIEILVGDAVNNFFDLSLKYLRRWVGR